MAVELATESTPNTTEIEAALAQLEALQNQLDGLRSSLLNLVTPLTSSPYRRSDEVVKEIRVNAVTTIRNLESFRGQWHSEGTKNLLAKAQQSNSSDGDLTKASSIPAWGWIKDDTTATAH